MNEQPNYIVPILFCCVYPIAAPIVASRLWQWIKTRDWKNINFPNLWRKDES